jgi:hypothetical protein
LTKERRRCKGFNEEGEPCGSPPPLDADYCLWHDPERKQEAAEARRIGGARSRRAATLATIYEVGDLKSVDSIRDVLRVNLLETLAQDNTIARSRAVVQNLGVATKLLEVGELEDRVSAIEAAHESRRPKARR